MRKIDLIKSEYPFLFNELCCENCGKKFKLNNNQIIIRYNKLKSNNSIINGCCTSCRTSLQMKKYGSALSRKDIRDKIKKGFIERFGVDNPFKSKDPKLNGQFTKQEKYRDPHYINLEKRKQTCLKKYGVDHNWKCKQVQNKIRETTYIKYGKRYYTQTDEYKNLIKGKKDLILEKMQNTCIDRYGTPNYNQSNDYKKRKNCIRNKASKTSLQRFGKTSFTKTESFRNLWNDKQFVKEIQKKSYITKKKNKTLNTSKPEEELYNKLKLRFFDAVHHYKDDNRYPFDCDFYIPSQDLFIELNFHWTHGFEPFDKNNKKHLEILNKWKSKNTKFYKIAESVWTIKDPLKLETFKKNKLNYKIFYNIKDFEEWFNNVTDSTR